MGLTFERATLFHDGFYDNNPDNHFLSSAQPVGIFSVPVFGVSIDSNSYWNMTLEAYDALGNVIATSILLTGHRTSRPQKKKKKKKNEIAGRRRHAHRARHGEGGRGSRNHRLVRRRRRSSRCRRCSASCSTRAWRATTSASSCAARKGRSRARTGAGQGRADYAAHEVQGDGVRPLEGRGRRHTLFNVIAAVADTAAPTSPAAASAGRRRDGDAGRQDGHHGGADYAGRDREGLGFAIREGGRTGAGQRLREDLA